MEETRLSVFVDESGSDIVCNDDPSDRYYVSVGVVVPTESVPTVTEKVDLVSQKFNNGQPLKSSRVGRNIRRRLKLLQMLAEIPFRYFALVIDKHRLDRSSGYQYRNSYYKNVNQWLYQDIAKTAVGHVDVIIDSHGSEEFEKSAVDYFSRQCNMFRGIKFRYVHDNDERLVQVADIIAGTLRQFMEFGISGQNAPLRKLLRDKEIVLRLWPVIRSELGTYEAPGSGRSELDRGIASVMLERAASYVEDVAGSADEIEQMQSVVLCRLIDAYVLEEGPIYSEELRSDVNRRMVKPMGRAAFLSSIIGSIRKAGIIVTGTKKGYKLATSEADVKEYLQHDKSVIMPMLSKLSTARNVVLESLGHDILSSVEDSVLRAQVEVLKDAVLINEAMVDEIDDEKVFPEKDVGSF